MSSDLPVPVFHTSATEIQSLHEELITLKEDKKTDDKEKKDRITELEKNLLLLRQQLYAKHQKEVKDWIKNLTIPDKLLIAYKIHQSHFIGVLRGHVRLEGSVQLYPSLDGIPHTAKVHVCAAIPLNEPCLLEVDITPTNQTKPMWSVWEKYITVSLVDVQ